MDVCIHALISCTLGECVYIALQGARAGGWKRARKREREKQTYTHSIESSPTHFVLSCSPSLSLSLLLLSCSKECRTDGICVSLSLSLLSVTLLGAREESE